MDLTANTLDNTIVLLGGSIIDDVSALAGNDTIQWHGGTITGTLDPGAGTDTLDLTVPDWARSLTYEGTPASGTLTYSGSGTTETFDWTDFEAVDLTANTLDNAIILDGDSIINDVFALGGNDTIQWQGGTITGTLDAGAGNDTLDLTVPDWAQTLTYEGTPSSGTLTYADTSTTETFDWTDFEAVDLTANTLDNTIVLLGGSSIDDVFALAGNDTIQWQGGTITGTLDPGDGTDTLDLTVPDWAETLTYEGTPTSGTLTYANGTTTETFDWTDFEAVDLNANALDNTIILSAGSLIDDVSALTGNDTIQWQGGTITGTLDAGVGTDTLDLTVPDWADSITYAGSPSSGSLTYMTSGTTETFDWTDFEAVDLTANDLANTIILDGDSIIDDVFALGGNDTIFWQGGTITGTLDAGTGDDTLDLTVPDWAQTLTYDGTPASGTLTYADTSTTETFDWTDFEAVDLTANTLDNTIVLLGGSSIDDVSALAGNDTIQWQGGTITGTLDAGAGTDTLNLIAPDWAETLTYEGSPASGTLTNSGSGITETVNWTSFESANLTGNTLDNSITLEAGSIIGDVSALAGNDTIQWQGGTVSGTLDAGDGTDTLDLTVPDWAETLTYEGTPASGTLTFANGHHHRDP